MYTQTLEPLPAAGRQSAKRKAQSVFPLNLPSPPSFVAELLRRTGTRGEEGYAPVRPERLPQLFYFRNASITYPALRGLSWRETGVRSIFLAFTFSTKFCQEN
jgi:hypothetical protein